MALEDKGSEHQREVVDKFHDPNANYQMTTRDYVLRPSAHDPIQQSIIITLPPVADAKGRFYSIISRGADAVHTITIRDKDDSECWIADIVMNGKCDRLLLYSDGLSWIPTAAGDLGNWPGQPLTRAPGTRGATTLAPTTQIIIG